MLWREIRAAGQGGSLFEKVRVSGERLWGAGPGRLGVTRTGQGWCTLGGEGAVLQGEVRGGRREPVCWTRRRGGRPGGMGQGPPCGAPQPRPAPWSPWGEMNATRDSEQRAAA